MGFLGSYTKILVGSSVYNLAGDEEKIPSYLKTVIANHFISRSPSSLARALSSSYLKGPGMTLRTHYDWSKSRYPNYAFGNTRILGFKQITAPEIIPFLPFTNVTKETVQIIKVTRGQPSYWAERWLLDNNPELVMLEWEATMPNGYLGDIVIVFPARPSITIPRDNFAPIKTFLFLYYTETNTGRLRLFIYEAGSGNAGIDSKIVSLDVTNDYLPVVPIRLDNQFISESFRPDLYQYGKKSLKKIMNASFDELVEKIGDNEKIDDIDFAFVATGVPLNTTVKAGREYLYRFFSELESNLQERQEYNVWRVGQRRRENEVFARKTWEDAGRVGPPPQTNGGLAPPGKMVQIAANALNYFITLEWRSIWETVGTGLGKPDAKVGELWWEENEGYNWTYELQDFQLEKVTIDGVDTHVTLFWQDGPDSWRKLDMIGLIHKNTVYKGQSTSVNGAQALADEELSGFFVPLRKDLLKELSLKDATELSASSMLLVLNCYVIKKVKWYQTGFFKILLVVAIIATIAFTGGFSAAGVGVLGTNLAVGTALGLTGLAAVVAGVVVNAVAAMIITSIITKGATALFGDQIGQIVGLVASFVAINGLSNFASTGTFAVNFSQLARVENIIKMTSSVGAAAAAAVQAETASIIKETEELMKKYEGEMDRISKAFAEQIGYGNGVIDPTQLLALNQPVLETPDEFLQRTLMTGSDIAEVSLRMVSNFTDISLDLDRVA